MTSTSFRRRTAAPLRAVDRTPFPIGGQRRERLLAPGARTRDEHPTGERSVPARCHRRMADRQPRQRVGVRVQHREATTASCFAPLLAVLALGAQARAEPSSGLLDLGVTAAPLAGDRVDRVSPTVFGLAGRSRMRTAHPTVEPAFAAALDAAKVATGLPDSDQVPPAQTLSVGLRRAASAGSLSHRERFP